MLPQISPFDYSEEFVEAGRIAEEKKMLEDLRILFDDGGFVFLRRAVHP
jgi:hypothetical protein